MLVSMGWYFIVVLVCISLMTNDVEHLFICLLPFVFFFEEMSIQIICSFLGIPWWSSG